MSPVRPLRLPSLTRTEAAAACRRHANRGPLHLGSAALHLCPSDAASDACGPEPVRIALRWGTADIALHCPADLVSGLLRQLDPALSPLGTLPPDLAAVLLEAACLTLIESWEGASRTSVQVLSVALLPQPGDAGLPVPPHPAAKLALELRDGPLRSRLHLHGTVQDVDAILSSWPAMPRAMGRLGLPAVLRHGVTRLSLRMLRSLRPGDAVLMQRHDGTDARLVLAGAWSAGAARLDGAWRLTERPAPSPDAEQGGWAMPDGHDTAEPSADPDDIPVLLTFEAGRLFVTLGQLRGLGPGSVLELGRSQAGLVEIAAHGRPVGQGELVEVDGAAGVRLLRLFDHG